LCLSKTKKPFKKFKKTRQTESEKIKGFILKNSQSGYFTRVPTVAYKFEITHAMAWNIIGELLVYNNIEAYHDNNGEMKVCAVGHSFKILNKINKKTDFKRNQRPY